jgi:glycosyl transferase family 25
MNNSSDIKNIFYINLDKRSDRKAHFENQMKMLRWQAHRFPAIEHQNGAIGCSMSHLKLLEYAKEQNLDHILIMEDDITFLNPMLFIQNLNKFFSSEIDFDVLLIAGNNMGVFNVINENSVQVTHCQTTTGYLVKSNYFDTLIDNFRVGIQLLCQNINLRDIYAIDQYWSKLQQKDKWLLLTPLTVTQKPDYSDIEKRVINYNKPMLMLDKSQYFRKNNEIASLKNIKSNF